MNIGKVNPYDYQEAEGMRILTSVLEQKRLIKTYFSENDKTPNQDGHFLVNNIKDNLPEKEFVVQIKTSKNPLKTKNIDGIQHFIYNGFETKFCNYINKKVTENPAIIFVIDVTNKITYWKYVGYEFLKSVNLEQETITLEFSNSEILCADTFYNDITKIIFERRYERSKEDLNNLNNAFEFLNIYSKPPLDDNIYGQLKSLYNIIELFCRVSNIDYSQMSVDISKIIEIANIIKRKEKYYKFFHDFTNISDIRTVAYWCYWIVKMKPLLFINTQNKKRINEKLAIFFMLSVFENKYKIFTKLDKKFIKTLEYHLIYHDISQESLYIMLTAIDIILNNGGIHEKKDKK